MSTPISDGNTTQILAQTSDIRGEFLLTGKITVDVRFTNGTTWNQPSTWTWPPSTGHAQIEIRTVDKRVTFGFSPAEDEKAKTPYQTVPGTFSVEPPEGTVRRTYELTGSSAVAFLNKLDEKLAAPNSTYEGVMNN
jgi:hypothetical protein